VGIQITEAKDQTQEDVHHRILYHGKIMKTSLTSVTGKHVIISVQNTKDTALQAEVSGLRYQLFYLTAVRPFPRHSILQLSFLICRVDVYYYLHYRLHIKIHVKELGTVPVTL
jgi:hypothetical protein